MRVNRGPRWSRLLVVILALTVLARGQAQTEIAAVPYRATVQPTGDGDLDRLLRAASGLIGLQTRAPTDAEGILSRIGAEPDKLRPALESEGYWAGQVSIRAPGRALEAAALTTPPTPVTLEITVDRGPRYSLRRVETIGGPAVPLATGGPARAGVTTPANTPSTPNMPNMPSSHTGQSPRS